MNILVPQFKTHRDNSRSVGFVYGITGGARCLNLLPPGLKITAVEFSLGGDGTDLASSPSNTSSATERDWRRETDVYQP